MPAIITHDFFGRDVYNRMYNLVGGSRDEADAFLLGNQGPDPLFYAFISPSMVRHYKLGSTMHAEQPTRLLVAFKRAVGLLDGDERPVGRAYALGFLCHYTLDSTMHPFVYSQQYELCDAGVPGLSRRDGSEVHAVIEREFDEMVLFEKRRQTVASYDASREVLRASDEVLAVVSKLYAYVAVSVYGRAIPPNAFALAVKDFRFIQGVLYSPGGVKREALGRAERLARRHSLAHAMSHRAVELTESDFDNRAHAPWENPFTGEVRTAGFWDLYCEASGRAQANVLTFDQAGFNETLARMITGDLNFSGAPACASVVDVEDARA